jgi:hypothetical protein
MRKDLNAGLIAKRSLCKSVTATATGDAVDTGSAPVKGFLVVTDGGLDCTGGKAWTLTFEGSNDDSSYAQIDDAEINGKLSATATRAFTTLEMTGVGVDADTFTIGTRVYELDTAATPTITAGRVRVDISGGATAADVCAAIILAINNDASAVATAAAGAGDTVVITAITEDATTGNAIATTEALTNGTVTGATMAGGVDAIALSASGTGAFAVTTKIPTDGIHAVLTYLGRKRYLRAVMTKSGAAPNIVTCASVLYGTQVLPVTP